MAQHNKRCAICQKIGHSKFCCKDKPFKPIAKVSKRKQSKNKKPINDINPAGKKAKLWEETKKLWRNENPPDEYGFWHCKIGGASLSYGSKNLYGNALILNVCHDKSRARYPSLAYNLDNLFPGCQKHNRLQGSKSFDEFMSENPDLTCGNY